MTSEERATVIEVRGDRATVQMKPTPHCGGCAMSAMCQAGTLRLELDAVDGLEPGQTVILSVDQSLAMRSILLLFGLPLAGLVAGAVLGQSVPLFGLSPDGSSLVFAVLFVAAALVITFGYERMVASKQFPEPKILRVERS